MDLISAIEKFLQEGGITSYMTAAAAIFLLFLAIDRIYYLFFKLRPADEKLLFDVNKRVLSRDYNGALQICNSTQNVPELNVIKQGLMAVESGREAMKSALSGAVFEINKTCEKRVPLIALIASVATLLGLLGTIAGMIRTFSAIGSAIDPTKKAEMLGSGISGAMTSTAAGLVVGIIAMVIHTICTVKIDEVTGEAQKTGFNLVTLIEKSERGE
jgi:biopolymer transport protein ExbB/TolQ